MNITNTIKKYSDLIPEQCASCGNETKGNPFCSKCGTFNVFEDSNSDATIKISTKHKNPLSLLDCNVDESDAGLSQGEILALRYRLSEEFSDTPFEGAIEEEFTKRIVPLLQNGAIGDKFFDLWVSYWKKTQAIITDCHSRINDVARVDANTQTGWDFGDVNLSCSHLLRDELEKSTREFLLNTENLLPIILYTEFAEKCMANLIWLQMGCVALRLCININSLNEKIKTTAKNFCDDSKIKEIVRLATTQTVEEIKERLACSIKKVPYTGKKELCDSALNPIEKSHNDLSNLISGLSNVNLIDTCVIDSAEERLCLLQKELSELSSKKTISSINVEAWISIKKHGFYQLCEEVESISTDKIAVIPAEAVSRITEYMASAMQDYTDSLGVLYTHADKYSKWEDDIQATLDDEDERLELEAQRRDRRDEEERTRRQQTAVLRNAQEQFLTRQVALRQKAEGKYFLSTFTEAFGADAGTYWEGIAKK